MGNLKDIQTFEDCKNAGFKIIENDICQVGEPYMIGGKYKTFQNQQHAEDKSCTDYHYSDCPYDCIAKCTPSVCGEADEDGIRPCTSDCDCPGSCVKRK